MENFSKMPRRLPFLGFSRGSFVILRKTRVFGVNIAFKCLDVIFRSFKTREISYGARKLITTKYSDK